MIISRPCFSLYKCNVVSVILHFDNNRTNFMGYWVLWFDKPLKALYNMSIANSKESKDFPKNVKITKGGGGINQIKKRENIWIREYTGYL